MDNDTNLMNIDILYYCSLLNNILIYCIVWIVNDYKIFRLREASLQNCGRHHQAETSCNSILFILQCIQKIYNVSLI